MTTTEQPRHMEVATEIKRQLGPQFCIMTGAHSFAGSPDELGALSFRLPRNDFNAKRINAVRIVLNYNDTYTVTFFKTHGTSIKTISEQSDVYCDDLRAVFYKHTNLITYMGQQ